MTEILGFLADYMARCEVRRQEVQTELLAPLTDRERALFREGAVAGFVQGTRFAGLSHTVEIPGDSDVLARALSCCISFPDLYPTVTAYVPFEDEDSEGERQ